MERISRYRILQLVFVIVFIISVFVIWNLVRNRPVGFVSINEIFQTRVPDEPTPVQNPTQTPTRSDIEAANLPTADPQNFTFYEVKPGDTLGSIAGEFNVTIGTIQQANGLENENIQPDDVLAIPNIGAFSLVGVAATVESIAATQAAVMVQATAVSATAVANELSLGLFATREQAIAATVEANAIKIDVLATVESQTMQEQTNWASLLTGPILTSLLAFGGFMTSTWFEWRDDSREQSSANADIERQKLEAELRLLNLEVRVKERELAQWRNRSDNN